ncbi:hypothetical protein CRG98_041743 [Punica granatum]|uniref:NAC domain-containing protein n=1 Tax=Punica granatum TaxID=22663 RepID=A0A2I0I1K8_PUNGR|nr:hypothetical protein CRG98_041743 [Punica granatum]
MMAGEMQAAIQKVPMGYRFHPTDDEVLSYYLRRKNQGLQEPECVIPEVDICRWEPRQLPGKFRESSIVEPKDPEWWFFCEQEPGRTHRRSTNEGFWKKTGRPRDLTSSFSKERKNYVLCMIKCNPDKRANSTPSFHEYEYERCEPTTIDWDEFLELEPDDGFIPEHLILATMQSLEPPRRTPTNSPPMMMVESQQHFSSSADSTAMQLSSERDSIELDSPLSASEDSDVTDFLNQVLIDQDDHFDGLEMQTDVFPSGVIQDLVQMLGLYHCD